MKIVLKSVSVLSLFMLTLHAFAEEGNLENGRIVFEETCFACHGEDGKGAMQGLPDFTAKDSVLNQDTALLIQRILEGFESGNAPFSMPPKGGNEDLTDEDIADVLKFMRAEFLK